MDSEQILGLYDWADGICFRHPDRGETGTTVVKTIQSRAGEPATVRACRDCLLVMEHSKRDAATRTGVDYIPGRIGDEAAS